MHPCALLRLWYDLFFPTSRWRWCLTSNAFREGSALPADYVCFNITKENMLSNTFSPHLLDWRALRSGRCNNANLKCLTRVSSRLNRVGGVFIAPAWFILIPRLTVNTVNKVFIAVCLWHVEGPIGWFTHLHLSFAVAQSVGVAPEPRKTALRWPFCATLSRLA